MPIPIDDSPHTESNLARPDLQVSDRDANELPMEEQARAELRNSAYFAVRRVQCRVTSGIATLDGCVPSYFLKQIAQSLLQQRVAGLLAINNQLQVVPVRAG